jgi:hypothetical protein
MEHYLDGVSKRSLPVMRLAKVTDFSPAMKARFLERRNPGPSPGRVEKWCEFDELPSQGSGNDK